MNDNCLGMLKVLWIHFTPIIHIHYSPIINQHKLFSNLLFTNFVNYCLRLVNAFVKLSRIWLFQRYSELVIVGFLLFLFLFFGKAARTDGKAPTGFFSSISIKINVTYLCQLMADERKLKKIDTLTCYFRGKCTFIK